MFDSYMNRTFGAESSYDPYAKNPRSSATGLGQFTDGTWAGLMQQYPDLGLTADGRTDPDQAKKAMERFTFDNASVLKKNGIEPSDNALYALHRFGPTGGMKLLTSDPSTPISALVSPDVMSANPDLNGKTAGQVASRWSDGAGAATAPQRGPLNFGPPTQLAQNGTATILPPKRGSGPGEYSFDNFKSNAPDAFMGAGAALASISSPAQGAALAQLAAQNNKDGFSMHIDPNTGAVLRINTKNGQVDRVGGSTPKLTETALKHVADNAEKYSTIQSISENAADLRKMISDGTLDLGAFNNWMNTGRNMAGLSNEQSRAYAKWEAFRQQLANDQLLQAKGVQTEGDAYRAMRQFSAGAAGYDNKAATQSLDTLIDRNKQAVTGRGGALIDSYSTMYGAHPAFKPYTDQLDSAKRFYDTVDAQRKAEAEKLRTPALTANPGARDTLKAKYGLK
jgi:hypothetical protein